jgi:hypothetical protein
MAISGQNKDTRTFVPKIWKSSLSLFPLVSLRSSDIDYIHLWAVIHNVITHTESNLSSMFSASWSLPCNMRCYFLILGAFHKMEQSRSSISPILAPAGVFYPQNHIIVSDVSCVACTKIQRLNLLFSSRRPLCNSYYIKSQVCFEQSPREITFKNKVLLHNPINFTELTVC